MEGRKGISFSSSNLMLSAQRGFAGWINACNPLLDHLISGQQNRGRYVNPIPFLGTLLRVGRMRGSRRGKVDGSKGMSMSEDRCKPLTQAKESFHV
jgi:hypothetical protein